MTSQPSREELAAQVAKLEAKLARAQDNAHLAKAPSFSAMLSYYRTYIGLARAERIHVEEAALQVPLKLRNVSLANSHGISAPQIFDVWPTIDAIDLTDLPDSFVLKADGGASGRAVFPLRRVPGGFSRVDGTEVHSAEEIRDLFRTLRGRAAPPFFAEELLKPVDEGLVPDDVKVYMFYGEPGQVLLMRPVETTTRSTVGRNYVDAEGKTLGRVLRGVPHDPSIPPPPHLPEIVEAARHLSLASGLSFCRVDFYDTPDGPRFGELTRAPGGAQRYVYDHDAGLGTEWLRAKVRLSRDEGNGRPRGTIWGPQEYQWYYEPGRNTSKWPRPVADCGDWS